MAKLFTLLLFMLGLATANSSWAASTYIVVNAPEESSLDLDSLEALLRGQRRNWDDGDAAKVVLPSRESPHFNAIAQKLLGTSGVVMQRLWFRLVFSGRVNAPDYIDSTQGIIQAVENQAGAIGILVADDPPEAREGLTVFEFK